MLREDGESSLNQLFHIAHSHQIPVKILKYGFTIFILLLACNFDAVLTLLAVKIQLKKAQMMFYTCLYTHETNKLYPPYLC